jgi:nicotinic acid mononucleotide adenylyltransferase
VPFLVVGRAGHEAADSIQLPPVSSTEVRARLSAGQPADGLVDADVIDYIRERGLYR